MSYGDKGSGSDGAGSGAGAEAEQLTESKYRQLYEEDMDPFKEFDSRMCIDRRYGSDACPSITCPHRLVIGRETSAVAP